MATYNIHGGHNPAGKIACGAAGILNESTEDRVIKDKVIAILRDNGHTIYDCTVDDGTSQNDVLNKIVKKCNAHKVDLDISIHFNAGAKDYTGNGISAGSEVWVFPTGNSNSKPAAQRIVNNLAAIGFRNRGVKSSSDLYVLRNTNAQALLVEVAFVDDVEDANIYRANVDRVALAIAEGIMGTAAKSAQPTPTPSAPSSTIYRVRKTWADAKSQLGAFGSLENAKKACKVGYSVFDGNGNVVYTNGGNPTPAPAPQPAPTPAPQPKGNVYYRVKSEGRIYDEVKNNSDYAGIENKKVWDLAMRVDRGSIQYRVHVLGGKWLPWVSGYNFNDANNGYAGVHKPIDAIQMKTSGTGGQIKYKVSRVGSTGYYDVVTETNDYAGVFGKAIDKVMAWIE